VIAGAGAVLDMLFQFVIDDGGTVACEMSDSLVMEVDVLQIPVIPMPETRIVCLLFHQLQLICSLMWMWMGLRLMLLL